MSKYLNASNQKLLRISLCGAVGLVGLLFVPEFLCEKEIRETGFYKNSIDLLQNYPPAVQHLGQPISSGRIDYNDSLNKLTENEVNVAIPVFGKKGRGILYTWATRENRKAEWTIKTLDIAMGGVPPFTFYKDTDQPAEQA